MFYWFSFNAFICHHVTRFSIFRVQSTPLNSFCTAAANIEMIERGIPLWYEKKLLDFSFKCIVLYANYLFSISDKQRWGK